jgi:soluble lytic murein transglycosylase
MAGICCLTLGGLLLALPKGVEQLEQWQQAEQIEAYEQEQHQASTVLQLVKLSSQKRAAKLQTIAAQPEPSLERSRARYLLAIDLLERYEGGPAVQWLTDLELDYPVMAPYILLKRGRGYELSNETIKAQESWQEIVEKYPDSPVALTALTLLGKADRQYWQVAVARFPNDPRLAVVLHQQLQQQPRSLDLMRQILQTAPVQAATTGVRDRLIKQQAKQLTPEDWQAVGDSFWRQGQYAKAIPAYQRAVATPQTLYRLARSQQLQDQKARAMAGYQKLIQTFPQAQETAQALQRLAQLSSPPQAIAYLRQLQSQFPNEAPQALLDEAELLVKSDPARAAQARQTLLKRYSSADAAAELRWQIARQFAKTGKIQQAWQWAQQLAQQNPESSLAPKAIFWIGKWAQQLNRPDDAQTAFKQVLARYPYSYYAWRSASLLGWPVGDFQSVRSLQPTAQLPEVRPLPPAGSSLFKELYRLGQDEAALMVFEAEVSRRQNEQNTDETTIPESFTLGLLQLAQRQYLKGINQILNLREDADTPAEKKDWQTLRQRPEYWQALFPLPYQGLIFEWSAKRQLNPLLTASLIRQESRFEKEIRSPVGATGLMQVMPDTAKWIAPQIKLKNYALTNPKDNIKLGTWYLDHTHDIYGNNSALAIASYNAGPGNVAKWLKELPSDDLDVFIENIPFAETKGYVEAVFSNYWNYLRIYDPATRALLEKST